MAASAPSSDNGTAFLDRNWSTPRCTAPASFLPFRSFIRHIVLSSVTLLVAFYGHGVDAVGTIAECPVSANITNYEQIAQQQGQQLDLFPVKATPMHAGDWNVSYYRTYKIVNQWRAREQYVVYQRGTPRPTNGTDGVWWATNAKVFETPMQRACLDGTTTATFLEMLTLRTSITGITSPEYLNSACLRSMVSSGAIVAIASSYDNATRRAEQLASSCDLLFGSYASASPIGVTDGTSFESSYLGRAEWIKFHALFFNKEAAAADLFSGIKSRFDAEIAKAKMHNTHPVMATIIFDDYFPTVPPYQVKFDALRNRAIVDANGTPFQPNVTKFATAAELMQVLRDANVSVVLDETYYGFGVSATYALFSDKFNLTNDPNTNQYQFITTKNVWRHDRYIQPKGGDDWFESAYPNADTLQSDFIDMIHPKEASYQSRWFRNIAMNESQVPVVSTCSGPNEPAYPYLAPPPPASYTCPDFLMQPWMPAPTAAPTTPTPSTTPTATTPPKISAATAMIDVPGVATMLAMIIAMVFVRV